MAEIAVITNDLLLYRKIMLALRDTGDVVMLGENDRADGFSLVFRDLRLGGVTASASEIAIIAGDAEFDGEHLRYPFLLRDIKAIARGGTERGARLKLFENGRRAVLDGKEISLTEVEGRLLLAIIEGGGEFVSRESLVRSVWGDSASAGVLNVYIHYLREKLEYRGEKIITASRKGGYKIEERYLGGKSLC